MTSVANGHQPTTPHGSPLLRRSVARHSFHSFSRIPRCSFHRRPSSRAVIMPDFSCLSDALRLMCARPAGAPPHPASAWGHDVAEAGWAVPRTAPRHTPPPQPSPLAGLSLQFLAVRNMLLAGPGAAAPPQLPPPPPLAEGRPSPTTHSAGGGGGGEGGGGAATCNLFWSPSTYFLFAKIHY